MRHALSSAETARKPCSRCGGVDSEIVSTVIGFGEEADPGIMVRCKSCEWYAAKEMTILCDKAVAIGRAIDNWNSESLQTDDWFLESASRILETFRIFQKNRSELKMAYQAMLAQTQPSRRTVQISIVRDRLNECFCQMQHIEAPWETDTPEQKEGEA